MNTTEQEEFKFWSTRQWPFSQLYAKKYSDFYKLWLDKKTALSGNVLDIGCGAFAVSPLVADSSCDIYLVDSLMNEYIKLEKDVYQNVYKSNHLTNGSSEKLDYENNFFNDILTLNCLDHMTNECAVKTVSELIRVLKVGGRLFILVDYRNNIKETDSCHPYLFTKDFYNNLFNVPQLECCMIKDDNFAENTKLHYVYAYYKKVKE
jgi:SAM-dependent methyltransferase